MDTLSKKELEHFRDQLERRKLLLANAVETGEQTADTVELDQAKVDRLSRMDALQVQAMSQETNRRRER